VGSTGDCPYQPTATSIRRYWGKTGPVNSRPMSRLSESSKSDDGNEGNVDVLTQEPVIDGSGSPMRAGRKGSHWMPRRLSHRRGDTRDLSHIGLGPQTISDQCVLLRQPR